jgi:hypothetical protein
VLAGLLGFLDVIGEYFQDRLLEDKFEPDYNGSFTVDSDATTELESTVGNALNVGALIFVPDHEVNADALLVGLKGKRFRLSYLLCPRYTLPLTIGYSVSLGVILQGKKEPPRRMPLFDSDDNEH